ncbi:hypothetical protein NLM24_34765 [Nocardia zapadnayensis]|nr:hypothetical protein [Nocardia zapadnayensis]MCX0275751.1 hypothetical protein [Nocardia zapadnayensis]
MHFRSRVLSRSRDRPGRCSGGAAAPIAEQSEQRAYLVRVVRRREVSERGLGDRDELFESSDIPQPGHLGHALVEPVETDSRLREQSCTAAAVLRLPRRVDVLLPRRVRRAGVDWTRSLEQVRTLEHRVTSEQCLEVAEVSGRGEASRVGGDRVFRWTVLSVGCRARGEKTVVEPVG